MVRVAALLGAMADGLSYGAQSVVGACNDQIQGQPTPVAPTIAVAAPKIVLVRRAYQVAPRHPHRIRVRLGTTRAFTGTGTLTCNHPANIRVYDAPEGGTQLVLPLANIPGWRLTAGHYVYVQGELASAAMNDITLTLTIAGGANPIINNPVNDTLTCVLIQLDLCQYKPAPGGADPAPLSDVNKINPGRNLHLQGAPPRRFAGRALLIVRRALPNAYAGNLVLSSIGNRVQTFAYADEVPANGQVVGANPLSTANAAIPVGGLRLWVEGINVSNALLDTGFTLGISDLPRREGDRVQITVVQAIVDVCQSRTTPTAVPVPIPLASKMNPGRYLHLQDAGNNHGRARVVVRRVQPTAFSGQLDLNVWDVTANSAANPRLSLFTTEAGAAAHVNPLNQPPAAGTERWAQGAVVSGALQDTELRLRVTDAEGYADSAASTVVQFTQIQATIHPTPANTPGNDAGMPAPVGVPADHVFITNQASEDFAVTAPLVLMRNGQPDTALQLTAAPAGLPVQWQAIRNSADHASLGGAGSVPTVTRNAGNFLLATLDANNKGSFRIRPYIDCNGANTYSPGEPSIPLNLILANATVVRDNSVAQPAQLQTMINAGGVVIRNGAWGGGLPAAGMAMELVADVTGGGADGRLGLNKVFAGLINNLAADTISATYRDLAGNHVLANLYVFNLAAATGVIGAAPMFQAGDPAPVQLTFPHLDSGRPGAGVGGETAVMGGSGPHTSVNRPVGQRWTIRCIDSPGRGFLRFHPAYPAAELISVHYQQQFVANFCFWTNISPSRGATNDPAERVYSVLRIIPWQVVGDWTVNFAVAPPTMTATTAHNITSPRGGRTTVNPIGRAQDHGVEVRSPSGITLAFAWDGR